jgi:hypothetical protein
MLGILAAAHRAGGHPDGLMFAIRPVCRSLRVVMLRNGAMIPGATRRRVRAPRSSSERRKYAATKQNHAKKTRERFVTDLLNVIA